MTTLSFNVSTTAKDSDTQALRPRSEVGYGIVKLRANQMNGKLVAAGSPIRIPDSQLSFQMYLGNRRPHNGREQDKGIRVQQTPNDVPSSRDQEFSVTEAMKKLESAANPNDVDLNRQDVHFQTENKESHKRPHDDNANIEETSRFQGSVSNKGNGVPNGVHPEGHISNNQKHEFKNQDRLSGGRGQVDSANGGQIQHVS